jgi:hypothetical protein
MLEEVCAKAAMKKTQVYECKSKSFARKQKCRLDKSKGKVMLVVFVDDQGLVRYEFIAEGRTVS